MPTIRFGSLGTFRFNRTRQDTEHSSELTTRNESCELNATAHDPPPPYSKCDPCTTPAVNEKAKEEESRSLHTPIAQTPTGARPVSPKAEQLRRYILEILAITVNANFDLLNDALYNIPSPNHNATSSLLSNEERTSLRELANQVHQTHHRPGGGQSKIDPWDHQIIFDQVHKPAQELCLSSSTASFVLDLIKWYSDVSSYAVPWRATLPALWAGESGRSLSSDLQVGDLIRALKRMVFEVTGENYRVREVLDIALEDCGIRLGVPPLGGGGV